MNSNDHVITLIHFVDSFTIYGRRALICLHPKRFCEQIMCIDDCINNCVSHVIAPKTHYFITVKTPILLSS